MKQIPNLPSLPGVYFFKQDDQLLYVGKAKNLKKRVTSYFQKQKTDWKIEALLEEHTHMNTSSPTVKLMRYSLKHSSFVNTNQNLMCF